MLIVPREHVIAMGALSDSRLAELDDLKRSVATAMGHHYESPVCAFEHGPSAEGCTLGCGVDHAHLHLVPLGFDIGKAVEPFMPEEAPWRPAGPPECRDAFKRGAGYLYFEQPVGSGQIATDANFGSQLFRRAIATSVGLAGQFSWRDHLQLPKVEATVAAARCWVTELRSCQSPKKAAA
jgi:hypothetical protein